VDDQPLRPTGAAGKLLVACKPPGRGPGCPTLFHCGDNPMGDQPHRTQIPLPGGSGRTPTGAMQFQGDWPGLFIRGDQAVALAVWVRELERHLAASKDVSDDLRSAFAMSRLSQIANIIERDVRVRSGESG
jgi:hypothetical protein